MIIYKYRQIVTRALPFFSGSIRLEGEIGRQGEG
jgi:hypothetical protein